MFVRIKLVLLIGIFVIGGMFLYSDESSAQTGVATLEATECVWNCTPTEVSIEVSIWDYGSIGVCHASTAHHIIKFDLSGVDFTIDKARLRYRMNGHEGITNAYVGDWDGMDPPYGRPNYIGEMFLEGGGIYIPDELSDMGTENGYEYWVFENDFSQFQGSEIAIENLFTLMVFCPRSFGGEDPTRVDVFNYFGLDSDYPPVLELADEFNELPEIEAAPTAVTLSNADTGNANHSMLMVVLIASLLLLPLTARAGRKAQ